MTSRATQISSLCLQKKLESTLKIRNIIEMFYWGYLSLMTISQLWIRRHVYYTNAMLSFVENFLTWKINYKWKIKMFWSRKI